MKLTRLGNLTVTTDGSVGTTKMRKGGCECESVEYLRDTGLSLHSLLLVTPVTGSERITKTVGDGAGLDGGLDVEFAMLLDTLLQVTIDIASDFAEEHAEQVGHKRTTKVDTLLAEVITVIDLTTVKGSQQETVDHVTEEVGLLGVGALRGGNVRQHLLLENLLCVDGTLRTRETGGGTTTTDEVKSNVAILDDESLFNAWLEHLEHGRVVEVVADVLQDFTIGHDAEGTEDNDNRDVVADVREGGANGVVCGFLLAAREELDLHGGDGLAALFDGTADLGEEGDGSGWCFREDVDVVGGHSL